jgi:uncharacterized protein with HEPN domain
MPSERAAKCFADILTALELIETWVSEAGDVGTILYADALRRSAIERQLLILSEAAIRLDKLDPTLAGKLAPEVDWPGVRGIGNFLRHKYDDLDAQIIADVLTGRLTQLRSACQHALRTLQAS